LINANLVVVCYLGHSKHISDDDDGDDDDDDEIAMSRYMERADTPERHHHHHYRHRRRRPYFTYNGMYVINGGTMKYANDLHIINIIYDNEKHHKNINIQHHSHWLKATKTAQRYRQYKLSVAATSPHPAVSPFTTFQGYLANPHISH